MEIYKVEPYKIQMDATLEALFQIFKDDSITQRDGTARNLWLSITEGFTVVLVYYNEKCELLPLLREKVHIKKLTAFQGTIKFAITERRKLEDREKIKLSRYLPAVLKVAALKIMSFQEWKEGDDELKQAMNLFQEKYNRSLEILKKYKIPKAIMCAKNSDPVVTKDETFKEAYIGKNKKDTRSTLRRYQCPYGCMAVFVTKNDLLRHQKATKRACKFSNADPLPVKNLPRSELALLEKIGQTIGKINEESLIPILPEDALAICIAMLKGIQADDEDIYEAAMNAILG